MLRIFIICMAVFCFCCDAVQTISAQTQPTKYTQSDLKQPVEIDAEQVRYEHIHQITTAMGNVVVRQSGEIINADQVTYDKKRDYITAIGHVVLYRRDGSIYYADKIEIDRKHEQGKLAHLVGRLNQHNARLTADQAEILDSQHLQMQDISFSTCPVCKDNFIPNTPIWRIYADAVHIDKTKERMAYKNARIDLLGMPIFYTPYFSTPAPGAKRKSGLLQPVMRWSKVLGTSIKAPIYANIAPDMDATFTPIWTEKQGLVQALEFRHLVEQGHYSLGGSFTRPRSVNIDGRQIKPFYLAHIEGQGEFQIKSKGHLDGYTGFAASRVHDKEKTYLKKYRFSQADVLRSHMYHAHFDDQLSFTTELLSFQGLRPTDNLKTTPNTLPLFRAHYIQNLDRLGAAWHTDLNFVNLVRAQSANYQRASITNKLTRNIKLVHGQNLSLSALARADGYNLEYRPTTSTLSSQALLFMGEKQQNGRTGRIYTELGSTWSWPLYMHTPITPLVIEPITSLYLAPNIKTPSIVPNEDSQYTELSTYNLWSANRYLGIDRRESGNRLSYGLKGHLALSVPYLQAATFAVGQVRRLDNHAIAEHSATLHHHVSGYVGHLSLIGRGNFNITERFTLDRQTLSLLLNEVYASLDRKDWGMGLNYVSIRSDVSFPVGNPGGRRQELATHGWYRLYKDWWASAKLRTRLGSGAQANGGRMVYDGIGVQYKGECINITADAGRDYTKLRDLKSSNTYSFTVHVPTNL